MSKLSNIARQTAGAQAIKVDDIVKQFGGVVTVNGFGYGEYKGERIPMFNFMEVEGGAFWGGSKKLREIAEAWEEAYSGDLQSINDDLQKEPLRIKIFALTKTASGKPFRPVVILGTVKGDAEPNDNEPNVDEETGEVIPDNPSDTTPPVVADNPPYMA